MEPVQVHHIVSLGCRCHTSKFFQLVGLKKYSCPFDWLACDIYVVLKLLETDFADFLNPKYLCDHPEGDRKCGHTLYGNSFFHHFNPRIAEHMAYYDRCVQRFKALKDCPSQEHVLYVHQAFYIEPMEEVIAQMHAHLERYSNNFTLLFIYYTDSNANETTFKLSDLLPHPPNVMFVEATIRNPIDGIVFTHSDDFAGLANFLVSQFDFSNINPTPFNIDDIQTEKRYITGLYL